MWTDAESIRFPPVFTSSITCCSFLPVMVVSILNCAPTEISRSINTTPWKMWASPWVKHLIAPCEPLAGSIAAWRACCPARKDCCDCDSGLRRRQSDLRQESAGLPGLPVCGDLQPARGGASGQGRATRSRTLFGDVEYRGARSAHCGTPGHLAENSTSRHLFGNAVDVRLLGRSARY